MSDEFATLKISIEASLKDFSAKMGEFEKTLNGTKEKAKETKSAFVDLGEEWKTGLVNAAKTAVLSMAGFAVIDKTIGFLKDARKESQEYKLAINQLTAGLGYYSKALVDQAEALEETMKIDASETLRAQARLSFYFKEEETIQKLIPAVLNLARAKGMDLTSAANLLAVSFSKGEDAANKDEASIRGLGISYKKTGDQAKDLDAMIKAVNDKVGGQAQAVLDSMDGWDKLGFAIRNITEDFGKLVFGVSKNTLKAAEYEAALKLVESQGKRTTHWIDQYGGSHSTVTQATEKELDVAKELINNYEWEILQAKQLNDEAKRLEKAADDATKKKEENEKNQKKRDEEKISRGEQWINILNETQKKEQDVDEKRAEYLRDAKKNTVLLLESNEEKVIDKQASKKKKAEEELAKYEKRRHEDKIGFAATEKEINDANMQITLLNARNTTDTISGMFQVFYELSGSKSKALFELSKGASAAESVISGIQGFMKTVAQFGLPVGAILGAPSILLGVANAAKIESQSIGGFAQGTRNAPAGLHWVGEAGPELKSFSGGEKVFTANQSRNIAAKSNQNITVVNVVDERMLDRYLASSRGQRAFVNAVGQNTMKIRKLVG